MSNYIKAIAAKGLKKDQLSKSIIKEIDAYETISGQLADLKKRKAASKDAVEIESLEKEINEVQESLDSGDAYITGKIEKFDLVKHQQVVENARNMGKNRKKAAGSTPPAPKPNTQAASNPNPAPTPNPQQQSTPPAAEEAIIPEEIKEEKSGSGITAGKVLAGVGIAALAYFGIAWKKDWFPFNKF
jgi:hypothetical protein